MKHQLPLSTDAGDLVQGFAGPIVTDHVGNLLVLASRELLMGSTVLYQCGEPIGHRPSNFYPIVPKHLAASLVGWFEIDEDRSIDTTLPLYDTVIDPVDVFDKSVEISTPQGLLRARVVSTNAYASFDLPWESAETLVEGLFRLSPIDAATDFPLGLAGAAVSQHGVLLGVIVGGLDGDALAVPARDIMDAEGLSFASMHRIGAHNEMSKSLRSRPTYSRVPKAIEAIRTTLGLPSSTPAQQVVEAWVFRGYDAAKTGVTEVGFSPFNKYFEGVSDTFDLTLRLTQFAICEISEEEGWGALDTVLATLGGALEEKRQPPNDAPRSSYKLVMEG